MFVDGWWWCGGLLINGLEIQGTFMGRVVDIFSCVAIGD
jgi:hypothetical protein